MTRLTDAIHSNDHDLVMKVVNNEDWLTSIDKLWFSIKYLGKHTYINEPASGDQTQSTPLHLIAVKERSNMHTKELIEALIKQGANVHARNCLHETPLDQALSQENVPFAKLLLETKAVETINKSDARYTPLQALILCPEHTLQDLQFFLNKGASPDVAATPFIDYRDIPGNALHYAVHFYPESKLANLELILRHVVNIDAIIIKDERRHTALSLALEGRKYAFAAALLRAGASPYVIGPAMYTGKTMHIQSASTLKFAGFPVLTPQEIELAKNIARANEIELTPAAHIQNGLMQWAPPGYIGLFARSANKNFGLAKFTPSDAFKKPIIYIYPPNNTVWGPFDLREARVVMLNFEKLVTQAIQEPNTELNESVLRAATTLVFSNYGIRNINTMKEVVAETAKNHTLVTEEKEAISRVLRV